MQPELNSKLKTVQIIARLQYVVCSMLYAVCCMQYVYAVCCMQYVYAVCCMQYVVRRTSVVQMIIGVRSIAKRDGSCIVHIPQRFRMLQLCQQECLYYVALRVPALRVGGHFNSPQRFRPADRLTTCNDHSILCCKYSSVGAEWLELDFYVCYCNYWNEQDWVFQ